jgi:dienelactone hydrolase
MFTLTAYLPVAVVATDTLTICIEGDGLAWVTRDMPSADPTPRDPVGLKLALAHPGGVAVYLARPCQYVAGDDVSACQLSYWTDKRFAPEVVAATSSAVDALKSRYGARRIQLVGYSGGGAVAALVAAHRPDVTLLVTVAGNLDTQAWTEHFRSTPLHGSLNPADFSGQLTHLKQVHLVAASDTVVPKLVADSYSSHFSPQRRPEVRVLEGYDHACCWEKTGRSYGMKLKIERSISNIKPDKSQLPTWMMWSPKPAIYLDLPMSGKGLSNRNIHYPLCA